MTMILARRRAPLLFGAATRFRTGANYSNLPLGATTLGGETVRLAHRSVVDLSGGLSVGHLLTSRIAEQFLLTEPGGSTQLVVENSSLVRYPVSLHTAIEYPIGSGTFYDLTYEGEQTRYARMGDFVLSDPLAGVPIPVNATFQTRTHFGASVVNNNQTLPQGAINSGSYGEGHRPLNPGVDGTLDATAVFTAFEQPFGPIGVFVDGHPSPYALAVIGDSVADGNLGDGLGWPEMCFTGITALTGISTATIATHDGTGCGLVNFSIGNMRAAEDALPHWNTRRMDVIRRCTDVIIALGTNDLAAGRTAAELQDDLLALVTRAKSAVNDGHGRVWVATIPPRTTSTDSWATAGNQTVVSTEADRVTVNTYLRTLPGGASGAIDIADTLETARNSGKFKTYLGSAITDDGIHPNANGRLAIPAAIGRGPFT